MSLEFLEKKAQEARKLLDEVERRKRKKQEDQQQKEVNQLLGKFYQGSTPTADDDNIEIYRVIKEEWHNHVKVEKWFWAHNDHYVVELTSWYGLDNIEFLKEITQVDFYHLVTKFLKKVGAVQAIALEQDH